MSPNAAAASAFPEGVERLRAALGEDARLLFPALDRLDWAMVLPSGAAPGLVYLAGAVGGSPVGGGGADLDEAAGRLAGEASEAIAQLTPPAPDEIECHPALAATWGTGPCIVGRDAASGAPVGVPMAAIFPAYPAVAGAPPRSLGLAAGPDAGAARLSGLLELVERDAAAAWWGGASRPRAVDAVETAAAVVDLARLREGAALRRSTALLALPSRCDVPVVCAMSRDADGRGLAFGFKAALDVPKAVIGSLREMLQMEIALEIARLRDARGRAAPGDAGTLARAALDPDAFEAFAALAPAARVGSGASDFDALAARLGASGVEVIVADLVGLDGGLAVAKVLAPALAPLPGRERETRPEAPGAWAALM